jgi:ABC-type nitrate/sulfonate/bicarbonate transport system permease component
VTRDRLKVAGGLIGFLVVWEAVGRLTAHGHSILPPPSEIIAQYWRDRDIYPAHIWATTKTAAAGFLIGNTVAILAALIFSRLELVEQVFRGVNITLFTVPAIVIGPIFVLVFPGDLPQIALSAVLVYFPTMAATLVGLRHIDPRLTDLVRFYGGGEGALLRYVRLRSSLPSLLAGLRIAASLAVLGAILGEFGSGTRWGLGTFLLGSLSQGNAARLWGIGLAATALAMIGYGVFAFIGSRLLESTVPVTIAVESLPSRPAGSRYRSLQRVIVVGAAILLPFVLWGLLIRLSGLSPIIAPGPLETLSYLFASPESAKARATLLAAVGQTLPIAALGLLSGLLTAFVLAALSVLVPRVAKVVLPIALVAQNIPLIALVPIVLLLFGRDTLASVFMAVLVVFFPAYVLLSQGFSQVPRAARDLIKTYGGGPFKELNFISVPFSIGYLFTAAKLVAPQALLGVMVAEWLLSGRGLGNLLNVSRGTLDYEMIWAGAMVSILISVAAYQAVATIEKLRG